MRETASQKTEIQKNNSLFTGASAGSLSDSFLRKQDEIRFVRPVTFSQRFAPGGGRLYGVSEIEAGRVGPFFAPVRNLGSNRATPRTRPLFALTPDPSLVQTFRPSPHVLRRQASPLGRAYQNLQPKFRKFTVFLALSRSPVQTRTASRSARFLSSSSVLRKGLPPWYPFKRDICSNYLSRVDFVQDLYLKELKVYKPAPKVPHPVSSPVPQP